MLLEALEAPAVVERLLRENKPEAKDLGRFLARRPPAFAFTGARGSSDHAATYAQYLVGLLAGAFTGSLAPSLFSVYDAPLGLSGALGLFFSQSGKSPDLVAAARKARARGALVVAITNDEAAPLAEAAEVVLPLHAGEERAVAATKTFIAELAALFQLAAHWAEETALKEALLPLPEVLSKASQAEWPRFIELFAEIEHAFVLSRGLAYAGALEAALKLKETAGLFAEGFSAAEFLHGPVALVEPGFPVLVLAPEDAALAGVREVASALLEKGAALLWAGAEPGVGEALPVPKAPHPYAAPLVLIQAFYPSAARLALARGQDPDRPRNLRKVTRTL
jgi:glucosamine--fructose-6-phosphate aminotransferase (isomerizing)